MPEVALRSVRPAVSNYVRYREYCHTLVCVENLLRRSSGSLEMAQAKAIYTKVGLTPSQTPVALRFHTEVLRVRPVALCPLPEIDVPLFLDEGEWPF